MTRAWSELLVDLPVVWDLGLRITLLLGLAWLTHLALARSNPRWRVQLWRFASVAVVVVAFTTFLPKVAISVTRPAEEVLITAATSGSLPAFGAAGPAAGVPEVNTLSMDGVWRSELVDYQPPIEVASRADEPETERSLIAPWRHDNWNWLLAGCWGIGACLLSIRWMMAQIRVRTLLSNGSPAPVRCRRLLQHMTEQLEVVRPVKLCVSKQAGVPFVAGWRSPTILLPAQMAEGDYQQELPAILAHELTHVRSRDLFWMGVAQWVAIPLWFHPFTWKIRAAHAMACEEVADAVAAENVGNVASYSGTLARVALAAFTHPPAAAAISMARAPEIMSRLARLKRGLANSPLGRRSIMFAAAVGLLALVPLAGIKFAHAQLNAAAENEDNNSTLTSNADRDAANTPGARVLEFPENRAVGTLEIATEKVSEFLDRYMTRFDYRRDWNWKFHSLAKGKVTIPPGAKAKLTLKAEGAKDTSWMKSLKPDDLYALHVFPDPMNANSYPFGDAQAEHLSHLTGLTELTLYFVQVSDRGMRHLESMQALETLKFYSPECGNDALESIGKLTSLEVLSMGIMKWTDAGLLHLANLKSLEEISSFAYHGRPGKGFDAFVALPKLKYIGGGSFTDAHLAQLKGAKALRALNLDSNPFITDASLAHLANVPQLEYLNLHHTNITDAGIKHLRPLKSLKELHLQVNSGPNIPWLGLATADVLAELKRLERVDLSIVAKPDQFLEKISGLENLRSLGLGGISDTGFITDAGVKQVVKFKNLERLTLGETELTDAAADSLAQLSNLESLTLGSSNRTAVRMTEEGIAKFTALKKLRYLSLMCNQKRGKLTFSGASRLNGLPQLDELWYFGLLPRPDEKPLDFSNLPQIEKVNISGLRGKDLAGLANCTKLRWLSVGFPNGDVTDADLTYLAKFPLMERLTISSSGSGVTDAGLVHLQGMTHLHDLSIRGNITDAGLRQIETLKSLGTLSLGTPGTLNPSAVSHLNQSLPGLYRISVNQDRDQRKAKKGGLQVGQKAPLFNATSLDGQEIGLEKYRGKVLLLYFWSTSCTPCVKSMPQTKKSYEVLSKYKDFAMVGLSGDDNDGLVQNFVKQHELAWPQVRIGSESKIGVAYGVTGYPRYVLIGRDGKILCLQPSLLDSALRKALEITDNEPN